MYGETLVQTCIFAVALSGKVIEMFQSRVARFNTTTVYECIPIVIFAGLAKSGC